MGASVCYTLSKPPQKNKYQHYAPNFLFCGGHRVTHIVTASVGKQLRLPVLLVMLFIGVGRLHTALNSKTLNPKILDPKSLKP